MAPGIVLGLFSLSPMIFFAVTIVAAGHAIVLGIPILFGLSKLKLLNLYTLGFSGFVVGAIPIAVWGWPKTYPEMKTTASNSTYGQTMVDGVPTAAGWLQYFHLVLYFSIIGLICGLVFWAALRLLEKRTNKRQ